MRYSVWQQKEPNSMAQLLHSNVCTSLEQAQELQRVLLMNNPGLFVVIRNDEAPSAEIRKAEREFRLTTLAEMKEQLFAYLNDYFESLAKR